MDLPNIRINPDNPRLIKNDKFKKLCASIKDFPKMLELRPMVVDKEGMILGGNMRFLALKELGMELKSEWVKVADKLTPEEKKRFIIEDNMPFGEWDWDKLANEFEVGDLLEWGFGEDELKIEQEVVEDEASEVSDEPAISKFGEVYQLGRHKLVCGDSTKPEYTKKLMGGKKADMVFTSPPYWVGKDYEYQKNEQEINEFIKNSVEVMVENTSKNSSRIIINTGTGNNRQFTKEVETLLLIDKWVNELRKHRWLLRHLRFWVKTGGLPASISPNTDLIDQHSEFIGTFYTPDGKHRGQNRINEKWVLQGFIDDLKGESSSEGHGAAYPVELPLRFIKLYSEDNAIILDSFGGAGTTLIACEQTNRICYMMEIDEKYCDVIRKRYAKFIGKEEEWQKITSQV